MEKYPWLKFYDEGVPHSLEPYPKKTLIDFVDEAVKEKPNNTMLIFKGRYMSYAEVDRLSDAFAAGLVKMGVKKGNRVLLLLPNCPQGMIARFGIWKAGGIVVAANPLYTEAELEHAFKEVDAEVVIVLTPYYKVVKKIQPRTKLRLVIATNIKEFLPPILRVLFTLAKEKKEGHRLEKLRSDDLWFADILKKHAGAARPKVEVKYNDHALILFSGGTTGVPKGVIGTHHSLVITGMQFDAWAKALVTPWVDKMMVALPLFHSYGTYVPMATGIVAHLPMILIPNPRDFTDVLATINKEKPAVFPGVPTLFIALMEHPLVKSGKVSFRSLKSCNSGAAPLLLETKKRFEALSGGKIVEGYALTETTMATVATPLNNVYKEGAVGIPLPDVVVRIMDLENGTTVMKPGETGEIVFKAPQLMVGYWNRPEETKEMLRDGWLYSGDIGHMDEDGYLYITSRKKELIKPGGFQVWPREVEEVISAHPAVAEVGVAGIPDPGKGEAVKAWVVLRQGATTTAEEIQNFCREKLVAYKVPKYVEFRDALPKTMVGKVLKRLLVEEEIVRQSGKPE